MLKYVNYLILVDLDIHYNVLFVNKVALKSRIFNDWHGLELKYLFIPLSLMLIHLIILSTYK